MTGIKVKDPTVKKYILKILDEELKILKEAHNSGVWTSQQYKERKSYITKKKIIVKSENYIL